MTALDDALAHPNIKRIFLAEITAGFEPQFWTPDTGTTYYAAVTQPVVDLKEDGSSLTEQSTVALCRSNAGSWFYDAPNSRVYVHATAGADPYSKTLQAMYQFYFANKPKVHNDVYYEPLLNSIPNLSSRVDKRFSGVPQIGGGNVSFINNNEFFDELKDLYWDAGETTIKIGVDFRGEMAYADYETLGVWLNTDREIAREKFALTLLESKGRTSKKIPVNTYDTDTYPNIRDDDIGRGIQHAYGVIKDAEPVYINQSTRSFKVAGHAIVSFDDVRVKDESTGVWASVTLASSDIANAEFTLGSSDWAVGQEVGVDFTGKAKSGTIPMDNASDIVKDILTIVLGEPSNKINTTSFTDAYNVFDMGEYVQTGRRNTSMPVGLYIEKQKPAEDYIKQITRSVFAYLFGDSAGQYYFKAFQPSAGEGLTEYTDEEITGFSEETSNVIISKVKVEYNKRLFNNWTETYPYEDAPKQYLHNEPSAETATSKTLLSTRAAAKVHGQRFINYEGHPDKHYTFSVPSRTAIKKLPSEFIRIVYPRYSIDGVYEILTISHDLKNDKTSMTVGDMHGIAERAGFVMDAADALPTRFANLTGYGSGSLDWNDLWHDEIKTWARQNVGYVMDDNGFADPTDEDSRKCSAVL